MKRLTAERIAEETAHPKYPDRAPTQKAVFLFVRDLALEITALKERVKALEEKKLPCSVCGGMHEAIIHVQV